MLLTQAGFQEKIRKAAEALKRSDRRGGLSELSRRSGYPYRTLQKWMNGKTMPSLVKIGKRRKSGRMRRGIR